MPIPSHFIAWILSGLVSGLVGFWFYSWLIKVRGV